MARDDRGAVLSGVARAPEPRRERLAARCAWVALGALALTGPALLNGYPILYSDTGTYLWTAFADYVPWDRSMVYGRFLRLTALGISPWLTVVAQALLVSWSAGCVFEHFSGARRPWRAAALTAAVLAVTTGAGITVSHLVPDLFTPLAITSLALLLAAPRPRAAELTAWSLVVVVGGAAQQSALLMGTAIVAVAGVVRLVWRAAALEWRRVGLAAAVVAAGWLAVPSVHALVGAGFRYPPGGAAFLVARLAETGLLSDYLAAECPHRSWGLCAFAGAIPRSSDAFLWPEDGPFERMGGGTPQTMAEYREIVAGTLRSPRWLLRSSRDAFAGMLYQLTLLDSAWVHRYAASDFVSVQLGERFPAEVPRFGRSRQQRDMLSFAAIDRVERPLVIASGVALVALFARRRVRRALAPALRAATPLLVAGLLLNAAICGALVTPNARYQSRLAFLVPLWLAVVLTQAGARRSGEPVDLARAGCSSAARLAQDHEGDAAGHEPPERGADAVE